MAGQTFHSEFSMYSSNKNTQLAMPWDKSQQKKTQEPAKGNLVRRHAYLNQASLKASVIRHCLLSKRGCLIHIVYCNVPVFVLQLFSKIGLVWIGYDVRCKTAQIFASNASILGIWCVTCIKGSWPPWKQALWQCDELAPLVWKVTFSGLWHKNVHMKLYPYK